MMERVGKLNWLRGLAPRGRKHWRERRQAADHPVSPNPAKPYNGWNPDIERQVPGYLTKHFWWAYLWPRSAPFFDHPLIISAILFGNYQRLINATLKRVQRWGEPSTGTQPAEKPGERMLQLTCVYGDLTPLLQARLAPAPLHITDVVPLQLRLARGKSEPGRTLHATRMNAEQLAYQDDSFSSALIFFLLHELPPDARQRVISQCLRTLRPGARLLITEYAEKPARHWFVRIPILRRILLRAEPFLGPFWEENLDTHLRTNAEPLNKVPVKLHETFYFHGFYRVVEYRIDSIEPG